MNDSQSLLAGILGGGCCCFLLLIVGGFAIYKLFFSKKDSSSDPSAQFTDNRKGRLPSSVISPAKQRVSEYGNLISRITDEGFYIFNPYLASGAIIHYRYRTGSGWVNRSIPYEPGPQGHFVYLGAKPNDVQVVDVAPNAPPDGVEYDSQKTIVGNSPPIPPRRVNNIRSSSDNDDDDRAGGPPGASAKTMMNYPSAY